MKKIINLLGLTIVTGALILSGLSKNQVKETKATDYESYILMEKAFFTNWTDDAGHFALKDEKYWPTYSGYSGEDGESYNYPFYAQDAFFRGEAKEGWQGTLTSRTWKQHEQFIYFQIGGAKNFETSQPDPVHLNIHYGNKSSSFYNNTFMGNPMMFRYFKIPDADYAELLENSDDFDMYIEIVDYQFEGYGFANFGFLHVNQTEEEVENAMRLFINNLERDSRPSQIRIRKDILGHFYANDSLKALFLKESANINEDFESNELFLNHWYFDWSYFNGANWGLRFDKAIGFDSARPGDDTKLPFNKTGNGFFRGWFENEELGGFVGGDNSIYRFISRPFILSGTGLVSIKMAGTASLHVIDTETRQDLVWADLLTYDNDESKGLVNLATSDFNTVTMVRHIINLEAYLGRNIQLAIADVSDGGWSALYVDELNTNYSSYPGFKVDTFTQTNTSGTFNCYRTDKYINSKVFDGETNPSGLKYVLEAEINKANDNEIINHVDNSPIKDAYNFLQNYYSLLRSPNNEFSYDRASDENKTLLVNAYNALSNDAQAIVDASKDIEYPTTFVEEWWENQVVTSHPIIDAFNALLHPAAVMYTVSFDSNGGSSDMSSVSKEEGSTYALPSNSFTAPEGYRFIGWCVGEDSTLRQPGYEFEVTGDVVIHAQWEEIPIVYFDVSFDSNGGTGSMASISVKEGDTYTLPENEFTPPKGYKFIGWTVGNDATLKQPGDEILVSEDVVVHAQWELIPIPTYTISFVANGGYGSMASVTKEEGSTFALPKCTFRAPTGKQFAGWKVNNDGELLKQGDEIVITSNIKLFAQWEDAPVVMCTISFNANGGTGTMAEVNVARGESFVIPECLFVAPEGKEFSAWLIGSVKYQPGQQITISGDTRFDALWVDIVSDNTDEEEPGKDEGKEQSNEPATVFEKVSETFTDIWNKIVEFFKNLFARLGK